MTLPIDTDKLRPILNEIDLGPTGSVQFRFAKLQLAQSMICKNQAEQYMKEIENVQEEQQRVADMIKEATNKQTKAKADNTTTQMSAEMKAYFNEKGIEWDQTGKDDWHNKDEWEINIKKLTNYQESISNKTQTLMVYLQDFISQYNSYLTGAKSSIDSAADVLKTLSQAR